MAGRFPHPILKVESMEILLKGLLNFVSVELTVMLTAALPVVELRGAIPVGMSLGLSPLHAAVLGFTGSMIPAPIILFTTRPFFSYLRRARKFKRLVGKITANSEQKSHQIQRYGVWGLVLLVALPFPGTGVWSGSLAAAFLDMRFKWVFLAILVGNMISGLIILGVSNGVFKVVGG